MSGWYTNLIELLSFEIIHNNVIELLKSKREVKKTLDGSRERRTRNGMNDVTKESAVELR